jgi:hypothetical protein
MEDTVRKFRVASVDGKILRAAPRPENLVKATKLFAKLGKDYQYEVLINGLSLPVPLVWGKYNDPRQWWSFNNYEILCATYQHETEIFLRNLSPYLPRIRTRPLYTATSSETLPKCFGTSEKVKERDLSCSPYCYHNK